MRAGQVELAFAAFQGFGAASASDGGLMGIYWKMSTDLSRPLVFAMGSHDVLDGFITFREVQNAVTTHVSRRNEYSGSNRFPGCSRSGQGLGDR